MMTYWINYFSSYIHCLNSALCAQSAFTVKRKELSALEWANLIIIATGSAP